MAIIDIKRTVSLDGAIMPVALEGTLYGGENQAHRFIINATKDGTALSLTGTVTASFLRKADDAEVVLTGEIIGGGAAVTLAQSCYTQPGRFELTIFLTQNGSKTALYSCNGNVRNTSASEIVDPGHVVPDISDIVAEYARMQAASDAAEAAAENANEAAQFATDDEWTNGDTLQTGRVYQTLHMANFEEETAGQYLRVISGNVAQAERVNQSGWSVYRYDLPHRMLIRLESIEKNTPTVQGVLPMAAVLTSGSTETLYSLDSDRTGTYILADALLVNYNTTLNASAIKNVSITAVANRQYEDVIVCLDHAADFDKIVVFGDSIFANYINSTTVGNGVMAQFASLMDLPVVNNAVGGATLSTIQTSPKSVVQQVQDYVGSATPGGTPLYIIDGGTNDQYNGGAGLANLGQYTDGVNGITNTIYGAIYAIINALLGFGVQPWQIVICTPIPKGIRGDAAYTATMDAQLTAIAGAMAEIAMVQQCNLINGYGSPFDNLISDTAKAVLMPDDTHPSVYGAKLYAERIFRLLGAANQQEVAELKSALSGIELAEKYVPYNDGVKAGYAAAGSFPAIYRTGTIVELNGAFGSSGPYFFRISGTVSKGSNATSTAGTPTIPLVNGHKYCIGVKTLSGDLTIPDDGEFDIRLYDSAPSYHTTIPVGTETVVDWSDANAALMIRATNSVECTNLMLCVYIKDCTEAEEVEPIKDSVRVKPIWEQGRYNTSTGAGQSSSYDIRTVYQVAISATCIITVPSGLELTWYKYGGYSYTTYETYSAGLTGVVILNNDGQYKFSLKKTNGETISPNEAASFVYETENSVFMLGPSGDTSGTTDLAQIRKVLYSLHECHLAPGDYYIGNGLSIPNDSTLHGCGRSTIIHYVDSASGSCITLGSCCSLKDFSLVGSDTDLVFIDTEIEPTEGARNAILFTGSNPAQKKGYISNLWISNFNGSGIRCADTGYGSSSGMNLDDCYIWNCYTGLNIFKSSEFHRISNVCIVSCFKAVVNNGGNNTFTNCSLSSSIYGFVMDDTDGDKKNNTHGEAVGCIMQHNRTKAIIVKGYSQSAPSMASGFMLVGCNVDDGGIECINAGRIVMSACNFMNAFSITVTNGGLLAFVGCIFRSGTENRINITNNNAVRFANCYLNDGSEFNPLS